MTTPLPPKQFTTVKGHRLAQEDSGAAIGRAAAAWLSKLD